VLRGIRWVVFDVGETLVDESRLWEAIAEQCGVSVATVCGVLGGLIERGEDYDRLWDVLGVDRVDPGSASNLAICTQMRWTASRSHAASTSRWE
jgi:hypothetical protein